MRAPSLQHDKPCSLLFRSAPARARGISLIEVLLVLAILGVAAGLLIPNLSADIPTKLEAAGNVVQLELEYARSLAVAHGSSYRVTANVVSQTLTLEHSGASTLLEVLPSTPMRRSSDPPDQQILAIREIPLGKPRPELLGGVTSVNTPVLASSVEFTSVGSTTAASPTTFWIAAGTGDERRFLPITVQPITGLVEMGEVVAALPSAIANALSDAEP